VFVGVFVAVIVCALPNVVNDMVLMLSDRPVQGMESSNVTAVNLFARKSAFFMTNALLMLSPPVQTYISVAIAVDELDSSESIINILNNDRFSVAQSDIIIQIKR
jgi:hypothetical protein